MARSGIAAIGAACLLGMTAMAGSASAQTAGAPLPLLQIDHANAADHVHHKPTLARVARTKSLDRPAHRHVAKRTHGKTRVADAARDLPAPPAAPPQATPQNDAQNIWSAPPAPVAGNTAASSGGSPPSGVTPAAPAAAPGANVVTEPVVETDPNGILNGGHAVPAAMPAPLTPAAQPAAPSPSPAMKVAAAAPAAAKSAVRAMLFRPSTPSPVGSASWIAQLLAALGGAVAAGAIAWFLIRPKPERTYG